MVKMSCSEFWRLGFYSWRVLKRYAMPRPFCVALSPSVLWHWRFLYCCTLHFFFASWNKVLWHLRPKIAFWQTILLRSFFSSLGVGLQNPHCGPLFSSIFDKSRKSNGQVYWVTFALRLYISYNHAHEQFCTYGRVSSPGQTPKCSKTAEVVCSSWKLKPCQLEIDTDKIQGKKLTRVQQCKSTSEHWLAQCLTSWPRGIRKVQHHEGIEPMSPGSMWLALSTKPSVHIALSRKTVYDSSHLATLNRFFSYRIVMLGLLKLNIKARHYIPEFLIATLLSIHVVAFDIDWCWNIFTSSNFAQSWCSLSCLSTSEKWELRTWNMKMMIRTQSTSSCISLRICSLLKTSPLALLSQSDVVGARITPCNVWPQRSCWHRHTILATQ